MGESLERTLTDACDAGKSASCIGYLYHRESLEKANFNLKMAQDCRKGLCLHSSTVTTKKSGQFSLHGKPTAFCLTPPDHHPDGWKVIFYRTEKFALVLFGCDTCVGSSQVKFCFPVRIGTAELAWRPVSADVP